MSLEFQICPTCNEPHTVMRNGEMSIHTNGSGARCGGSGDPEAHIKRRQEAERDRIRRQKERDERSRLRAERAEERSRLRTEREQRQALERAAKERERALAVAAEQRFRRYVSEQMRGGKLDRKIYATRGVHTVSGGLPSLGKRA
ncbi:hypothetical protein ACRAWC_01615 [Leifsonia sp. L25]|uniref:hypothetical protein n=1 Tax=Actinomycetes TaxID=1760 RepID=UPI003D691378